MLDVNGAFALSLSNVEIELYIYYLAECTMQQKSQVYLLIGDERLDGNNFRDLFHFHPDEEQGTNQCPAVSVTQSVISIAFLHQYSKRNCNRFS